jgi:O-antigen ligase
LFGLWQYASDNTLTVEGVGRVFGVYKHPNNLALYLGRVAPFAACMALFLPWGWRKTLYGLSLLPLAATLLLTYSRGAWAAVALAMLVAIGLGLFWRRRREESRGTRPVWVTGAAAGLILLVLSVVGVAAMPNLPERIVNFDSGSMRMLHWQTSARMLADRPIFGVGLDQFLNQFQARDVIDPEQCQKLYQNHPRGYIVDEAQCKELYTAHPHNLFLDYWLSLGIMGVLVLLLLLWRYFRVALIKIKQASSRLGADPLGRAVALGLLASMIDFVAHGMVDNSYFLMDLATIFWLSCGLLQTVKVMRNA